MLRRNLAEYLVNTSLVHWLASKLGHLIRPGFSPVGDAQREIVNRFNGFPFRNIGRR
jgi:hypothetical protein